MTPLDREYAILLPNGELLTNHTGCDHSRDAEPQVPPGIAAALGWPTAPQEIVVRVVLFSSADEAQKTADHLRAQARKVGVDNLGVRVVSRWCGPWHTPDEGEQIARAFLDYNPTRTPTHDHHRADRIPRKHARASGFRLARVELSRLRGRGAERCNHVLRRVLGRDERADGLPRRETRARRDGAAMTTSAEFVEDYTYLRECGLDHQQIAQRLGVKRASLMRRVFRNGCLIPERNEVPILQLLDQLIATAEPFHVSEHFARSDSRVVAGAVMRAYRTGRIVPVDTVYNGRHWVRMWCAAEAAQAVAS